MPWCLQTAAARSEPLIRVVQASTYCHYAEAGGVHALLAGEVSEWPGLDMVAAHHDGACLPVTAGAHPVVPLILVQSGVGAGLQVSCCMGLRSKWCSNSA